jgi:hypothetical protein
MADTTIDIQDIIDEYGSYYLDAGQNQNDLLMRPFEKFGTRDAFFLRPTTETILRLSDVEVEEILQGYQDDFTAKGSATFRPVVINLTQVKIDNEFNPNKLVNSWLGFLTNEKVDRSQYPFIKWFIEDYLLKQVDKDLETKCIYKGTKVTPTPGTAGAAINAMDGVKKQINAGITAGDITPIVTGAAAIDPVDFCDQVEEFASAIPELYWDEKIVFNFSKTLHKRYRAGRQKKYNLMYAQVGDLDLIEDTAMSVMGRTSMSGSEKIWGTMPTNYVMGVKGFSNASAFEIEKVKRKVAVYSDWWMGIGYLLADQVFTNDQDLV